MVASHLIRRFKKTLLKSLKLQLNFRSPTAIFVRVDFMSVHIGRHLQLHMYRRSVLFSVKFVSLLPVEKSLFPENGEKKQI